jgi:glycosyltransferase involved in cell wall biosynthesis
MEVHVSCILTTGNRPAFTRQAIRCFMRQTRDDSELIVVDDGAQPVAETCAGLCRVTYIRLDQPTLLGTKLNIGVKRSSGAIIQKLDDDDYYHPEFLQRAADQLRGQPSDRTLVAWDCFLVLLTGERRVRFSGHGWTAGGTLCFHRDLWERQPFRDAPRHVDTLFIEDHRPRIVKVCAPEMYILVRHGANTWTHLSGGVPVDAHFRRLPLYRKPLADLVEPIDRPFYGELTRKVTA